MVIRDDFHLKSKTYIKIENELQCRDSGTWWAKPDTLVVSVSRSNWKDAGTRFEGAVLIYSATFF